MYHCISPLTFFVFNLQALYCLFTHAMTDLVFGKKLLFTSQVSFGYVHVRAKIEQQLKNLCMSYDECVIALLVSR
jgi:hypothetical protein